jgi:hypothetical protein
LPSRGSACCARREAFYNHLAQDNPRLAIFLSGWMNRLKPLRREVGLPGYESAARLDFGDTGYVARLPDIGEDPSIEE